MIECVRFRKHIVWLGEVNNVKEFYKGHYEWKYDNDGDYDKDKMLEWVKKFCEWEEIKYDPEILYTNDFVEFVLLVSKDYSTNVKGTGKFIKKNQKIYDSGNYTILSADCLFKTFLYILEEMRKQECAEESKRRLEEKINQLNIENEMRKQI